MASKRTKFILLAAGGVLVLGPLLALLLLPVWFPWAVRVFTSNTPLQYSRYERVGYGGFRLVDAGFTNAGIKFSAGTVEGPLPTTWAWQRWQDTPATNSTPVRVQDWQLTVEQRRPNPGSPGSVYTNVTQALEAIDSVANWLPAAVASNGTAVVSGQILKLSEAAWGEGAISALVSIPDRGITGAVSIAREPDGSRKVSLVSTQSNLEADFRVTTSDTNVFLIGQGTWLSNRLDLRAAFDRAGTLPESASLRTTNLTIPAERLRLPGYRPVTGSVSGEWNQGRFSVSTELTAEPEPARTNYPRAVVQLQASGNTNAALVETATIDLPWLQANLSAPVSVMYEPPYVTSPASFNFSADLANQPFAPAKGQVRGSLNALRGDGDYPIVHFSVNGEGIEYQKLSGADVEITGGLDYPTLRVTNANVTLANNSSASLRGVIDLRSRTVEDGALQGRGHLADPWLPRNIGYGDASFEATFRGAISNLSHTGQLKIAELQIPDVLPVTVAAEWSGTNLHLPILHIRAQSTNVTADLRSSLQVTNSGARLALQNLAIAEQGRLLLGLQSPTDIEFTPESNKVRFSTSPLRLAGRVGMLELEGRGLWPSSGQVRLAGTNLNSDALSNIVHTPVSLLVQDLAAGGSWSNGPAQFAVDLRGTGKWLRAPSTNSGLTGQQIEAVLSLSSTGESLAMSNLLLSANSVPLLSATGRFPLSLRPDATGGIVRVAPSGPMRLQAEASSRSPVWTELGRIAGLELREPNFKVNVDGSLRSPKGAVQARVQRVAFSSTNALPLDLRDLVVDVDFNRDRARIGNIRMLVQGRPLLISGSLPLGDRFWDGVRTNALPDWRGADLRVLLTNAPVSSFATLFPSLLVPEGFLNVDLALRNGGAYGNLVLSGASLRPIPGVGPIHAIDLKVLFNGPTARIENTSARFGTSSLLLNGQANIADWDWRNELLPPARLTLRGREVPLSRTPDLILRGDLDLKLNKTNGGPMLVAGKVELKKSYFLTDLRDLISGGTAGARRAPPFFSIQAPFLAPWRLDLSVVGDKFMKIRSPVFNGQVSANLKLLGTLKEPISLGDVRIDSGVIRFPFTSFRVEQGSAVVTSRDPTRPQLSVVAAAKQFGYDLKLEVSGPADAPILQFSSTPPLSSDRILLMITAGQLPGADQVVTPERRAQAFATFLGRDLINKLGGTEPTEPRLTIQSGQQMTDEGRPTYLVEYMFLDDWYLVGEYDRFNEYNVGVKWRFYSK